MWAGARRPDVGDRGRARSRVHVTLEQAGGGGRFLQVLWAGSAESGGRSRKRPSPGPLACHCSLFAVTLLPAKASLLLSALQALSSALPASLREEREAGLGEVERFIPGEQAAGADAALRAGVAAVPVSAARGVGRARGAGSGTAGELGDVRKVLWPWR